MSSDPFGGPSLLPKNLCHCFMFLRTVDRVEAEHGGLFLSLTILGSLSVSYRHSASYFSTGHAPLGEVHLCDLLGTKR